MSSFSILGARGGQGRISSGNPGSLRLDAAQRCGADVIVVGSADRTWVSTLLRPGVARSVVKRAPVPVLVVNASDQAAEARTGSL
jgi:nucleotide-binding universal stress UspA family protein